MTAKPRHDPNRLTVLARVRDAARAQARHLNDRLAECRETKTNIERRLQIAELSAQGMVGAPLESAMGQIASLKSELTEAREIILDVQADLAAAQETAAEAQALLREALRWASQNGLEIPRALADEAAGLDRPVLGGGRVMGAA